MPTKAIAYLTGGPASYAAPSIVFGTIDGTNVNLTVTSGWKYVVVCFV